MNVLGSLIQVQPEKAVQFTRQFAKLYRNILQLREQLLIPLQQELEFVQAYLQLQLMRFEGALKVEMDISPQQLEAALPPFAMQTVIENAIKHNIISEAYPLQIKIHAQADMIQVQNNLQRRPQQQDSTQTGLQNLRSRYALLGQLEPKFEASNSHYTAYLPLIPIETS